MPLMSSTGRVSLQQTRQPLPPCSSWGVWRCRENTHKLDGAGGRCSPWHLSGIHFSKIPPIFYQLLSKLELSQEAGGLNCTRSSRNLGFKPIILKDALAGAFEDLALIFLSTSASREDSLQSLRSNYIRKDWPGVSPSWVHSKHFFFPGAHGVIC